jgi:hypothetical protein
MPLRLPLAVRGMGRGRHRVDVHHGDGAEDQEWWQKPKIADSAPYLAHQILKWFYDTFTGAAMGAARCDFFIERGLWSLGHQL